MTLIQTRRIRPFPVILVGTEYWSGLIKWIKEKLLKGKRISPDDMDIIMLMDDPVEVIRELKKRIIL